MSPKLSMTLLSFVLIGMSSNALALTPSKKVSASSVKKVVKEPTVDELESVDENPLVEENWTESEAKALVKLMATASEEDWKRIASDLKDMGPVATKPVRTQLNSTSALARKRATAFLNGSVETVISEGLIIKHKNKETGALEVVPKSPNQKFQLIPEMKSSSGDVKEVDLN
jgi:hypothetical protein